MTALGPDAPPPLPPPSPQPAAAPLAPGGFWDGFTARTAVFDLAGLAFVGAAIYTGLVHGTGAADFGVFAALAGAYLGLKASS